MMLCTTKNMLTSLHTPLRFNFIKADAQLVHFINNSVGRSRLLGFRFKKELYHLQFLHQKPENYDAKIYLRLKSGENSLFFCLSQTPPLELFDPVLKDLTLTSLPPDLVALVLESFSSELLNDLEKKLNQTLSLEDVLFMPPKESFAITLYFKIINTKTKSEYMGHFWLNEPSLSLFSALSSASLVDNPIWLKAPLQGRIQIGTSRLSKADLLKLEPNDIILLDDGDFAQKNRFKLDFGQSLAFEFQHQNNIGTFIKMSETPPHIPLASQAQKITSPSPVNDASPPEASTLAPQKIDMVDKMQVNLSFEVGQKKMTIQDLKTVNTGFTFELDDPVTKPVSILLEGTPIGLGELLQIGGKVGVRVIEFNHNG